MSQDGTMEFELTASTGGFVTEMGAAKEEVGAAFSDLSDVVGMVGTALGALSGVIGLVTLAVAGSTAAVVALIALGVPVLIAATVLAVGGLVLAIKAIGEVLYNNFPAVKEFVDFLGAGFGEAWGKIKAGWAALGQWFESSGMKEFLVGVWEDVNAALGRFFKFARPLWDEFLGWLSSGLDKIGAWWKEISPMIMPVLEQTYAGIQKALGVVMPFLDPIIKAVQWIISLINNVLMGAVEFVVGYIGMLIKSFLQMLTGDTEGALNTGGEFFAGWLGRIFGKFGEWLLSIGERIGTWIVEQWNVMLEWTKKIRIRVVDWVKETWNEAKAFLFGVWDGLVGKVKEIWGKIKETVGFDKQGSPSMLQIISSGLRQTEDLFSAAAVNVTQTLRPAMQEGFGEMVGPMAQAVPVAAAAVSATPSLSLTVNVNGGMMDARFLDEQLIPKLENAIYKGRMLLRTRR